MITCYVQYNCGGGYLLCSTGFIIIGRSLPLPNRYVFERFVGIATKGRVEKMRLRTKCMPATTQSTFPFTCTYVFNFQCRTVVHFSISAQWKTTSVASNDHRLCSTATGPLCIVCKTMKFIYYSFISNYVLCATENMLCHSAHMHGGESAFFATTASTILTIMLVDLQTCKLFQTPWISDDAIAGIKMPFSFVTFNSEQTMNAVNIVYNVLYCCCYPLTCIVFICTPQKPPNKILRQRNIYQHHKHLFPRMVRVFGKMPALSPYGTPNFVLNLKALLFGAFIVCRSVYLATSHSLQWLNLILLQWMRWSELVGRSLISCDFVAMKKNDGHIFTNTDFRCATFCVVHCLNAVNASLESAASWIRRVQL